MKDYWREFQVLEDVQLIKKRIGELIEKMTPDNFEIYKLLITAILNDIEKQFERRKEEAKESHLYAWKNERDKTKQ